MTRWFIIIPFLLILVTACSKKTQLASVKDGVVETEVATETKPVEVVTEDIDFDALSIELCGCASEMLKSLEQINKLAEAGDTEAIEKLSIKVSAQSEEMDRCIDKLEAKYPTIDGNPENETKAEAALAKNCPELTKMMNSVE